jgi:uncharacterized protein (TIRG00374 family)
VPHQWAKNVLVFVPLLAVGKAGLLTLGYRPLLPVGFGMVEMTSVALLTAQGVPAPEAVALGLVHRLVTFWFAIGLGTGCLIVLLRGRGDARA